MSEFSVQDANSELEGLLHGTTTAQIENLTGVHNRTARQLLLDLDPQETIRIAQFAAPIFEGVVDYAIAPDVKGNKVIDIRPQVNRLPRDVWSQAYNQAFDIAKQNVFSLANMFTINFNTGLKTIRINAPFLPPPVIVNYASSTDSNGTWTLGGGASNLTVNYQNYVIASGALNFNLPSGTSYIENSTMSSLDLSEFQNQGTFFLYVYMPTASQFTNVKLRWGSTTTDYYEVTATQTQQETSFQNGWNLLQFAWLGATQVGTPDVTAIDYTRVTFTTTAAQTAAGLNYITVSLGNVLEYEYYSKYMFRDAITGAFQEKVTDTSNLINLDTETYNLYLNLLALNAVQQMQGGDSRVDADFFRNAYLEGLARYKSMYKAQNQKPQSQYYRVDKGGYTKYLGRGYR